MIRPLITLATLLLVGCGPTAREAVLRAQVRWYMATGVLQDPPPPTVREAWGPFGCGGDIVTGCYHYDQDVITIDVRRGASEIDRTALHEVGHRLGLPDGGRAIMGPQQAYENSDCITVEEIFWVCVIHPCKWERPECQ